MFIPLPAQSLSLPRPYWFAPPSEEAAKRAARPRDSQAIASGRWGEAATSHDRHRWCSRRRLRARMLCEGLLQERVQEQAVETLVCTDPNATRVRLAVE